MHYLLTASTFAAGLSVAAASSLSSVCNTAYAKAALPSSIPDITIDSSSLTTAAITNYSVSGSVNYPNATFDYCNVTFAYSHNGRNDRVLVTYWMPTPEKYANRFLTTGGGGLAINSGASSVAGGVSYGAASGLTDGGFGGFDNMVDAVFLLANGSINWEIAYLFGYQAIHEMTVIGHAFTKTFYNSTKLYRYYQACSEGGREGFSQVQRYADQFDGALIGAPAFRYGQQQVNHLSSNLVEKTVGYYPPPCELEKIVNLTIAACDPLDGLTDGVIARPDLCRLHLNSSSFVGQPYYCPAVTATAGYSKKRQSAAAATPAQNGTVTAKGVEVADTIIAGLKTTKGEQVYLSYEPGASFVDAQTVYNSTTDTWELDISGLGGEWITRFLNLQNTSTLASLDNFTYDTLRDYMEFGMQKYYDVLQTTWPDLTPYASAGAKVLHYHGGQDSSVPPASSVRYYDSVRKIMYPHMSYNASTAALQEWYRLFLVPGAAHCTTNTDEPNGPWPQTMLNSIIEWVEKDEEPVTLPAQFLAGKYEGQNTSICAFPLLPMYSGGSIVPNCVYDQAGINEYHYDLNAFKFPVF